MTRYERIVIDLSAEAEVLRGRIGRFDAHPTLHTRVPGVRAELAKIEAAIPKAKATAKWAKELYG